MEEFRIAHQRMFGGKENNGGGGVGALLSRLRSNKSNITTAEQKAPTAEVESSQSVPETTTSPKESPPSSSPNKTSIPVQSLPHPPTQKTKVVSSAGTAKTNRVKDQTGMVATASRRPVPQKSTEKSTELAMTSNGTINTAHAANRITIKVLSPKLGS